LKNPAGPLATAPPSPPSPPPRHLISQTKLKNQKKIRKGKKSNLIRKARAVMDD
jgi:hypothetical protein